MLAAWLGQIMTPVQVVSSEHCGSQRAWGYVSLSELWQLLDNVWLVIYLGLIVLILSQFVGRMLLEEV